MQYCTTIASTGIEHLFHLNSLSVACAKYSNCKWNDSTSLMITSSITHLSQVAASISQKLHVSLKQLLPSATRDARTNEFAEASLQLQKTGSGHQNPQNSQHLPRHFPLNDQIHATEMYKKNIKTYKFGILLTEENNKLRITKAELPQPLKITNLLQHQNVLSLTISNGHTFFS